jgi:hypothetical protein
LKLNGAAGSYDVVALTNWRGDALSSSIDVGAKLGIDASASYIAFDFWNQNRWAWSKAG